MSQSSLSAITENTPSLMSDTWIKATWEEYLQVIEHPVAKKAKSYFYDGKMRLEMSPLGNPHSRDHAIMIGILYLFAGLGQIDLDAHDNCTYRKTGYEDAQPDISFYIGTNADVIPWNITIIDLDSYPTPDLVIEVAYSSLADDMGEKRLLYELLGVKEYWILDVQNVQIIAFKIENGGSRRIKQSEIFEGLEINLLEEALRRSRQMNHGKVSAWLLSQWQ